MCFSKNGFRQACVNNTHRHGAVVKKCGVVSGDVASRKPDYSSGFLEK